MERSNPNPTPEWVRETLINDLMRSCAKNGHPITREQARLQVMEDLRRYNLRKGRGAFKRQGRKRVQRKLEDTRAGRLAARKGYKLYRRTGPDLGSPIRPNPNCACRKDFSRCLSCKMRTRLGVLCSVNDPKLMDFRYPEFANAIMAETGQLAARQGLYKDLDQRAANLAIRMKMIEICDRSAERFPEDLGPWR